MDIELRARQFLEGEAPTPSTLRSATLTLPPGLTVNPDAADGQTSCSDAQAGFGTGLGGSVPGQLEDRDGRGAHAGARRAARRLALHRRTAARQPVPAVHALRRLRDPREARGRRPSRPADRPADRDDDRTCRRCRSKPSTCTSSRPTGACWRRRRSARSTAPTSTMIAVERARWRRSTRRRSCRSRPGPTAAPARGRCGRSTRGWWPGTSNPLAGDFSAFSLKLDRDDGDQFLGDLNFKMPPGFTGDLRGIGYCPDASIAAAAAQLRPRRAGRPELPGHRAEVGHDQRRRRAGRTPVPRGRQDVPGGPLQGRAALSSVAITPALAGPYDYGVVVVRVALHVDPLTAQVTRRLGHGALDHRRHPDPDALDPGQHRQAELHDQPDQLLAVHGRLAGDRRPGHGHRLLVLTSRSSTAPPCPSSRTMKIRQLGGTKGDEPVGQPGPAVRPADAQRRRQHQVAQR